MAENGLQVRVVCEIPSNVILAGEFADHVDGFSSGSNDLTQLTFCVDPDSGDLAELFNEEGAVKWMIVRVIEKAGRQSAKISMCGQASSDRPDFAAFLVDCGINSMSVSPDSFIAAKKAVAEAESGSGFIVSLQPTFLVVERKIRHEEEAFSIWPFVAVLKHAQLSVSVSHLSERWLSCCSIDAFSIG